MQSMPPSANGTAFLAVVLWLTQDELTTTRYAGGLDFTAKGGKRQGREVLQSLKTTRFGKPNKMGATYVVNYVVLHRYFCLTFCI
jgi:hypothetical protein